MARRLENGPERGGAPGDDRLADGGVDDEGVRAEERAREPRARDPAPRTGGESDEQERGDRSDSRQDPDRDLARRGDAEIAERRGQRRRRGVEERVIEARRLRLAPLRGHAVHDAVVGEEGAVRIGGEEEERGREDRERAQAECDGARHAVRSTPRGQAPAVRDLGDLLTHEPDPAGRYDVPEDAPMAAKITWAYHRKG
jgi:hypothetical protein